MALLSNNLYRDDKYKLDCKKKINYLNNQAPTKVDRK